MCKVSIIVPIYNPGMKLNKCIKSIINQTFKEFELILVNDGSTDDSIKICNKYASKDSRIKIIDKKNEGSIKTRIRGIKEAIGKYIMFVDADDWVSPIIVERLYDEIIENKADISICNMYKTIGNNSLLKKKYNSIYFEEDKLYEGESIRNDLASAWLHGHPLHAGVVSKMYKKEILINSGKYLDRIKFLGDDLYYNLEMFLNVKRVKIITEPLYYYRVGGFTSRYMPDQFDDIINGYNIQKEVIEEYYLDTKSKRYNGISVMLLNSFKSTLSNIIDSKLSDNDIKRMIKRYAEHKDIISVLDNEGCRKCFDKEFLDSIKNKEIDYLYSLAKQLNKNNKIRSRIVNILSRINCI